MLNLNLSKEVIGNIAKGAGKVIVYAVAIGLPYVSKRDLKDVFNTNKIVEYDDVISAIMNSSMLSSDKVKAVNIVTHGNPHLHRAAIQVVDSSMLTSDKLKVIERIYSEEQSQ